MRARTTRRRKKATRQAVAKGDEPPEAISLATATLIAAGIGGATAVATPFISKALAPKAPKLSGPSPRDSVLGSTKTPGQKTNLINTSSQGVLSAPTSGRSTLLGG